MSIIVMHRALYALYRTGRSCASVMRKVSFCLKQIQKKNQIIMNSMKYVMSNITILNISSIMIRILSGVIVTAHI